MVDEINKAQAEDAGCWIAGWWGQYAVARMIALAGELGFEDEKLVRLAHRHLDQQGPGGAEALALSDDEWETLHGGADGVELWLNREVAPAGFAFHWTDGEFFLSSIADLEEEG